MCEQRGTGLCDIKWTVWRGRQHFSCELALTLLRVSVIGLLWHLCGISCDACLIWCARTEREGERAQIIIISIYLHRESFVCLEHSNSPDFLGGVWGWGGGGYTAWLQQQKEKWMLLAMMFQILEQRNTMKRFSLACWLVLSHGVTDKCVRVFYAVPSQGREEMQNSWTVINCGSGHDRKQNWCRWCAVEQQHPKRLMFCVCLWKLQWFVTFLFQKWQQLLNVGGLKWWLNYVLHC